ncbi:hypothetical protein [Paracoccus kondratievae]|uniref:hypothetical protein n=1 Tax=Paracoccus kondratievae TaxID=135740 RepID=UPI0022F29C8C|nr:hypothetical protein [Paracoccus kondratievae]
MGRDSWRIMFCWIARTPQASAIPARQALTGSPGKGRGGLVGPQEASIAINSNAAGAALVIALIFNTSPETEVCFEFQKNQIMLDL